MSSGGGEPDKHHKRHGTINDTSTEHPAKRIKQVQYSRSCNGQNDESGTGTGTNTNSKHHAKVEAHKSAHKGPGQTTISDAERTKKEMQEIRDLCSCPGVVKYIHPDLTRLLKKDFDDLADGEITTILELFEDAQNRINVEEGPPSSSYLFR